MNDIRVIMLNRYKEDKYKDGDTVYIRIVVFRKGVFLIYLMGEKDYNRTKFIDQYYLSIMDYSSNFNTTFGAYSKLYSTINTNILSSIDIHGSGNKTLTVYCNVTSRGNLEIFSDDNKGNRVFSYITTFDTGTGDISKSYEIYNKEVNIVVDMFNFTDR